MTETIRRLSAAVVTAWQERRTDDGGLTDEVAMIAILVGIAVAVGGILLALLTGAASSLSFDI
jgi:hypothetical protein